MSLTRKTRKPRKPLQRKGWINRGAKRIAKVNPERQAKRRKSYAQKLAAYRRSETYRVVEKRAGGCCEAMDKYGRCGSRASDAEPELPGAVLWSGDGVSGRDQQTLISSGVRIMGVDRRFLLARLVEGEAIISRRAVPFPHRFYLAEVEEVDEASVARLVDEGIVAPKPEDPLWDRIAYRVSSQVALESTARAYWPRGFGRCPVCRELLAAGQHAKAPRHGADKSAGIPPCGGTGSALVGVRMAVAKPAEESRRVA